MKKKTKYIIVGVYNDSDGFLNLVERMSDTIYSDRQSAKRGAQRIASALLATSNELEEENLSFDDAWTKVDDRTCTGDYGFDPIDNLVSCRRIRIVEWK